MHVVEDEVVISVVDTRIEDRDEVRMPQSRAEPSLATQRLRCPCVAPQVLEWALDDDVPLKPVGPLDAREVDTRRATGAEDVARLGQLVLDRRARRFTVAEEALDLPAREFEVLWELMSPPGHAVSKRTLSDKLSGFDASLGDNALEAFISRLRKKLAGSGASIRTLRGIGNLMEPEA